MDPFVTIAGLVVLAWAVVRRSPRGTPERTAALWRDARTQLGAREDGERLLVELDGVTVVLELDPVPDGRAEVTARASRRLVPPLPPDGELWMFLDRRGALAVLEAVVEGRPIVTGDDAFDRLVGGRTSRPALARALLDGERRTQLAAARSVSLGSTGAVLNVRVVVHAAAPEDVVVVARAAAACARAVDAWRARWQAAAEALGGRVVDGQAFEVLTGGRIVRVAADAALEHVSVSADSGPTETLAGVEPDVPAWRAAIERVLAAAGARPQLPYR